MVYVKQISKNYFGIPLAMQHLICEGKQVHDLLHLHEYSISKKSIIIMLFRLHEGGMRPKNPTSSTSNKDATQGKGPIPMDQHLSLLRRYIVENFDQIWILDANNKEVNQLFYVF